MIQLTGQFVPVKVNAEKEGVDVAKQYQVQGYPTILFINGEGKVEGKIGGYLPPGPFADQLNQISDDHRSFPIMQERLRKDPHDAVAAERLAAIYAGREDMDHALPLIQTAELQDPDNATGGLARAENAVGDYYQGHNDNTSAVPYFQKAAKVGKTPKDVAYADLSLAQCYASEHKKPECIAALKATLAVPNCPPEEKQMAQQALDQLNRVKQ